MKVGLELHLLLVLNIVVSTYKLPPFILVDVFLALTRTPIVQLLHCGFNIKVSVNTCSSIPGIVPPASHSLFDVWQMGVTSFTEVLVHVGVFDPPLVHDIYVLF